MTDETPPAPPPLTEDQRSGRLFARFNLITLVIGVVALAIGAAVVRGS